MEGQIQKPNESNGSKENGKSQQKSIVSTDSKDCPICLALISNRSLTDKCLHEFCFDCIKKWSENHNRCPVCRQIYRNIIYNIVSEQVFDRIPVAEQTTRTEIQLIYTINIDNLPVRNRTPEQRRLLLESLGRSAQRIGVRALGDMQREMQSFIHRLIHVLRSQSLSETEFSNIINELEEEMNSFDESSDQFDDYESNDSMPSLESMDNSISDEREEYNENAEQIRRRTAKRSHSNSKDLPKSSKRNRNQ